MKKILAFLLLLFIPSTAFSAEGWGGYNTFTKQYRTFNVKNFLPGLFTDCQDGAGHINYTAATNTFSCGTSGSGGSSSWGSITGTLSNQTDLQSALDAKVSGTGTDNHITRWNGTNAVQDSTSYLDDSGRTSLGWASTPTAVLTLAAGTTASGTAPLKIAPGNNLTTPEDGAIEYNGTHFYGTVGSTRYRLDQQGMDLISVTSFTGASTVGPIDFTGNLVQGESYYFELNVKPSTTGQTISFYLNIGASNMASVYWVFGTASNTVVNSGGNINQAPFHTINAESVMRGYITPFPAQVPVYEAIISWEQDCMELYGYSSIGFARGTVRRQNYVSSPISNINFSADTGTMSGYVKLYKYKTSL